MPTTFTPDAKTYTWSEFVAAINALLPIDSNRMGSVPALIALWTRVAVIELQNYIGLYRKGHETLFLASDFTLEGFACRAAMPPQAHIQDAFFVVYDAPCGHPPTPPAQAVKSSCQRYPLSAFDWANRMALVHGKVATNGGVAVISIDPQANTFYVYPGIKDCQAVSVFWEGLKVEFQDDDQTPFDEQMTMVVADYVKARISREVDKDLPLHESYYDSYTKGRTLLYLNAKERGRNNL